MTITIEDEDEIERQLNEPFNEVDDLDKWFEVLDNQPEIQATEKAEPLVAES